uniref:HTH psq-type domain-containing protein n=1 Tax=Acrobeloides nanus TaxID=290746 RepID=A0A914DN74_9BILA
MTSDWYKLNGKRSYFQCSQIHNAIQAVLQGRMTVEKSSTVFQVPKSTIYRRIQAINIEWDTYNNIVQTSDRQVQYEREDGYFASTSSYPGSSQIVYEEDGYYMPLRNGSQMLAEHEVLTISKGPLRLRKQSIHSRPISRKAALKSTGGVRTKNRANQLMLNPDKDSLFLTDHAYSLPQDQEIQISSQQDFQPSVSPPPPLLYMGDEELIEESSSDELVEEVIEVEEILDSCTEPDLNIQSIPQIPPQQIRVLDGKGQCIKVLEVEIGSESQS